MKLAILKNADKSRAIRPMPEAFDGRPERWSRTNAFSLTVAVTLPTPDDSGPASSSGAKTPPTLPMPAAARNSVPSDHPQNLS